MEPLAGKSGISRDKTVFCEPGDSIHKAIMLMHAHKTTAVFVKDGGGTTGIITVKGINEFLGS